MHTTFGRPSPYTSSPLGKLGVDLRPHQDENHEIKREGLLCRNGADTHTTYTQHVQNINILNNNITTGTPLLQSGLHTHIL